MFGLYPSKKTLAGRGPKLWFWLLRVRVPSATRPCKVNVSGLNAIDVGDQKGAFRTKTSSGRHQSTAALDQSNHRLRDYKIVIEATLQICNLARHVQKALRHMAIFTTIIQQPLAVRCNIDSAFCAEQSKQRTNDRSCAGHRHR
jgi:hypothetical protein